MVDIVERLRIRIHTSEDETVLTNEAADEIERLREALQQVIDLPEDSRIHYKVARRALQQKDTE